MKQIKIPVHSFIDVITNSSTEIYMKTHDGSVKYLKEFINTLMIAAESDKKADDLFDFDVQLDDPDGEYEDREADEDWEIGCDSTIILTPKDKNNKKLINVCKIVRNIFEPQDVSN